MTNKTIGIIIAVLLIVFVFSWVATDGFRRTTSVTIGSLTLPFTTVIDAEQLISATSNITDGNYDSLDFPLGTSHVVNTGKDFIISGLLVTSSTASLQVFYGFGDTHVENSSFAPTNAVILGSFEILTASGLERIPVTAQIPENKNPFVRVVGADSNGHISMVGVER